MTDGFAFDDRLLNRYSVENLEASHPELYGALQAWFGAFADFDDTSVARLLAARAPDEVHRRKPAAQVAVDSIPRLVQTLEAVIGQLERALAAAGARPIRQLEELLDSAKVNRTVLVEQIPALLAGVSGSVGDYAAVRQAAETAVERAARQVEDLRRRSVDATRPYAELKPLANELKEVWSELDRALALVSRPDQRALRGPHDAPMRQAADALCRNLFERKTRDRLAGAWPPPEIPQPGNSAPEAFAAALARGDNLAAERLLAPWLSREWTAQRLADEVRRSTREIAAGLDLGESPPPGTYSVSRNPMRFADVSQHRPSHGTVPEEITADNFAGWFPIHIQPDEEDAFLTGVDYLASLFVVAVRTPVGERIGYVEFGE